MKLLLDTHTFIWWACEPEKLSKKVLRSCENKNLSAHHRDPFDRLLIAQAREEKLQLVSKDRVFSHYSVESCW
jgi:PIN domain nuclease of toxin-antitoxin system